jgi:phospholipase/carboxylesterase
MNEPATDLGFIHRFVPARDEDLAPLVLLHGTGGDENDLVPLGARLAPGAALVSPRGKVVENGMPRYFRRIDEGEWDIEDFKKRTVELADFIAKARATYRLAKPIAVGFSNGANVAWSLLLHDPGLLAGAILIRAMLPFDPRPLPELGGIPVLMLSGASDPLIPHEQAGLLAAILGEAGADVTYELLPAGHGLSEYDLTFATRWLAARR